jgi:feruloyl esterase
MLRWRTRIGVGAGFFVVVAASFAATDASAQSVSADMCTALSAATFADATVVSAQPVAADAQRAVPAFCEARVVIAPVKGSRITAVYRMPVTWNARILGIGGGGFAGNLALDAAIDALKRGYAIIQNDLGHSGATLDPSFAILPDGQPNTEGIIDFGHRATHLATTVGKQVIARLYGRTADHAYWQGCSTGGRQGLAEVQRYPDDYDGVIAGAPVYTPLTYSNAILRVQAFHAKPESNLLPAQVPLIQKAVIAACDAKDGVSDGILTDPRACKWDPAELACKVGAAASANCLSAAQVQTVRRIYDGVKSNDGQDAAMPLMRGGESDWVTRMIGTTTQPLGLNAQLGAPFMAFIVKHDAKYDLMTFDPDRDMSALRSGIAQHVHQENPDISPFIRRGGKLLLWHGFNDPGPSPLSTIAYFEAVGKKVPAAKDSVRLFLAPGVLHCGGGAGPDRFDALTAMEQWVEQGKAPASMIATKANSPISRPLCAYPLIAKYNGTGDANAAASFSCSAP